MTLVTKVGGVLLVGGGIVGAGTAYALNSGTQEPQKTISIKEKLASEGKKLLEGEDQDLGGIKLATYARLKEKDTTFELTPNTNDGLKKGCTTNIEQEDNETNQKLYARVKEVCTVPSNKEKLLKDKKELATEPRDGANRTNAYKGSGSEPRIDGIDKSNIKDDELKNGCSAELEKDFTKTDSKENLCIKGCTKTGT